MTDHSQFTPEVCAELFGPERANDFFEAMYGDASEGAYDIALTFERADGDDLHFAFVLTQRPGHCLACNLTYGLPQVFSRHPVIGVAKLAEAVGQRMGRTYTPELGRTSEKSRTTHTVPLVLRAS